MTDELDEQQVIQDMNTKRVDRILYIDKISGIVITIEIYQVYNEEECFYKYNNKKLNKTNIEKLQKQYLCPLNEEHIEKLKEEQVTKSLANKRKQAKSILELKIDDDDKFYTVTKIKFHKLKLQDMINRVNSGEIRLLEDPKDRSIEEICVRKKQDEKLAQEYAALEKEGKNQGLKRVKSISDLRYEQWNEDADKACDICEKVFAEKYIPSRYSSRSLGEIVSRLAEEHDITKKTIYKYLRRYLQGGSVRAAVYNDYYIGNDINNKVITTHIGRKSPGAILGCEAGVIIDDEMKKLFTFSICKWYENKKNHSLQAYIGKLDMHMKSGISKISTVTERTRCTTTRDIGVMYALSYLTKQGQ